MFDVLFQQGELGRPVAATPAIPKARAAALQKGFLAAMKSAGLRADAKKAKLPIDPSGAKEAVALLNRFYAMPKPVINALKKNNRPEISFARPTPILRWPAGRANAIF